MTDGRALRPPRPDRRYRVDYAAELNPEQLRVVMHPGGPMLALAGAGTGKTRTLVYRASRLVEDGVPAPRVLLLTFTNKAAREMLDRVERITESVSGRVPAAPSTRSAIASCAATPRCSATASASRSSTGRTRPTSWARRSPTCSPELPAKRTPQADACCSTSSAWWSTPARPRASRCSTGRRSTSIRPRRSPRIYRRYLERKRQLNAMDFDDLLLNWLLLLPEQPAARRRATRSGSSTCWWTSTRTPTASRPTWWTAWLRRREPAGGRRRLPEHLLACAGADFRNILGFPERYPDARDLQAGDQLPQSTPEILAVANACIAGNPQQFAEDAARGAAGRRSAGRWCRCRDADGPGELRRRAAARAARARASTLEDMAVLYRGALPRAWSCSSS